MRLPIGERAQVLLQAARLLQRHMAAGRFLQGAPSDRCRALVPLGGRLCAGLRARPFFAARADISLQLQGLALHLQEAWLHRLRMPARIRPRGGGGDTLPHDLFPPHPGRGASTAPPRSPPAAGAGPGGHPGGRAATAAARRGQRVGGGPVRATWLALVPPLPAAGLGNQPVLPRRARGTHGAGTGAPPAKTDTRPAGASTGGPPGGGKRALGMARTGQTWCPRSDLRAERARHARLRRMTPPLPHFGQPHWGCRMFSAAFWMPCWHTGAGDPAPVAVPNPPPPSPQGGQGRHVRQGRVQGHREQYSAPMHQQHSVQRTAPRRCTCTASTEHGIQCTTGCST